MPIVVEEPGHAGGHNVIQDDTIGGSPPVDGASYCTLVLSGADDTIGGSMPGQGNVISGGDADVTGCRRCDSGQHLHRDKR